MNLQRQLVIALVGLTLLVAVPSLLFAGQEVRRIEIERRTNEGVLTAEIVVQFARYFSDLPARMEDLIGEQMIVEAKIAAHLVAAAEAAGETPEQINARLRDITDTTVLDEFWITNENGEAYLKSEPAFDFTFSPDPQRQPQASEFWPLLTGASEEIIQEAQVREVDDQVFKYAAVAGVDSPRIVQVGYSPDFLNIVDTRVALPFLLRRVTQLERVEAVWVLDEGLRVVASAYESDLDAEVPLNPADFAQIQNIMIVNETVAQTEGDQLRVFTPIRDDFGVTRGAVLVYLPLNINTSRSEVGILLIFSVLLLIAAGIAYALARRLSRPILQLNEAAGALAAGHFSVQVPTHRQDEYGQLARSFKSMAEQLQGFVGDLEERVVTRTRDLQAASEAVMLSNRHLQIAYDVMQMVNSVSDVNELMQDVGALILRRFELDHVLVFCLVNQQLDLRAAILRNKDAVSTQEFGSIALDNKVSAVALAAHLKETVSVEDVKTSMMKSRVDLFPDTASEFAFPLIAAGEVFGVLNLLTDARRSFSEVELRLLETIAQQLALALRTANLSDQLRDTTPEAQPAAQTRGTLTSGVADELRQPLYQIMSSSELLLGGVYGVVTRAQNDILQAMVNNADSLLLKVNGSIGVSQIEVNNQRLYIESVDCNRVFKDVQAQANTLMKERAVIFASDIMENLPPVWADERRLRQVLLGLLAWLARESQRVVFDAAQITDGVQIMIASDVIGMSDHPMLLDTQALITAQGGTFRYQPRTNDSLAVRLTLLASSIPQQRDDTAE